MGNSSSVSPFAANVSASAAAVPAPTLGAFAPPNTRGRAGTAGARSASTPINASAYPNKRGRAEGRDPAAAPPSALASTAAALTATASGGPQLSSASAPDAKIKSEKEKAEQLLAVSGWRRCLVKENKFLAKNLEHDDYNVIFCQRDGDCLFHCFNQILVECGRVNFEMNADPKINVSSIRGIIANYFEQHNNNISYDEFHFECDNIASIRSGKGGRKAYGGVPEIVAFGLIYDISITVFAPETTEEIITFNPGKSHSEILLNTLGWQEKGTKHERTRGADHWQRVKPKQNLQVQQQQSPPVPVQQQQSRAEGRAGAAGARAASTPINASASPDKRSRAGAAGDASAGARAASTPTPNLGASATPNTRARAGAAGARAASTPVNASASPNKRGRAEAAGDTSAGARAPSTPIDAVASLNKRGRAEAAGDASAGAKAASTPTPKLGASAPLPAAVPAIVLDTASAAHPSPAKTSRHYICEHNKRRTLCSQCGGKSLCTHGRQKVHCKLCRPERCKSFCRHGRQKSRCVACKGKGICEHKKDRYRCKVCQQRG